MRLGKRELSTVCHSAIKVGVVVVIEEDVLRRVRCGTARYARMAVQESSSL